MSDLIVHAIYNHAGRTMIAVSDTDMVGIADTDKLMHMPTHSTQLVGRPGSDAWINIMIDARTKLLTDLANERAALRERRTYIVNLGEALLEEAERRDWCDEYNSFAKEWDLPLRESEFDVTVTVRVKTSDEDAAREYIAGELGFDQYAEKVVGDVEITAEAVR